MSLPWPNWTTAEWRDKLSQKVALYSDDQPRDPAGSATGGQWAGDGSELSKTSQRAFTGEPVDSKRISKLDTGALGEELAIRWLKSQGFEDARSLNVKGNNFAVDLVQDHEVYEVKAGLASNSHSAQQWRATIGQPGPEETAWLAKASDADKAKWNERKMAAILKRKEQAVKTVGKRLGHAVKAKTLGLIIDPARRIVDVHQFNGFHLRVGWGSDEAKGGYVGSFRY